MVLCSPPFAQAMHSTPAAFARPMIAAARPANPDEAPATDAIHPASLVPNATTMNVGEPVDTTSRASLSSVVPVRAPQRDHTVHACDVSPIKGLAHLCGDRVADHGDRGAALRRRVRRNRAVGPLSGIAHARLVQDLRLGLVVLGRQRGNSDRRRVRDGLIGDAQVRAVERYRVRSGIAGDQRLR